MAEEVVLVICVDIFSDHTADSLKAECCKCKRKVWISPHHLEENRKPICVHCVQHVEDPELGIDTRDIVRAYRHLKEKK